MSPKDREIFFRYSYRIRHLSQSVGPEGITLKCSGLSDDVIFALSNPPTHGPLIPHLRTLRWDQPNRKYAPLLRLLLTPSLVTLDLPLTCTLKSPEVSILASIGVLCPSLKSLNVAASKPFANSLDSEGAKDLSRAIVCLHSLESLWCPALDETAIVDLSRLPFLAHLSLELQPDFQLEKVQPFISPPAFSSIASLKVRAEALSTLTSLLKSMFFQPVTLSFVVARTPTKEAVHLFFITLAGGYISKQLSRISLTTTSKVEEPGDPITLSTFQSILALSTIKEFTFDIPYAVSFDDDALTSLMEHWPGLISLSLNEKSGWNIPSRVTHRGLITLLSHCPRLTKFALSIDFSELDGPYEEMLTGAHPGGGVINKNCLTANFVTSTIKSPVTIAAFLSDVIPEAEDVKSAWYRDVWWADQDIDEFDKSAFKSRWNHVDNLLPMFSTLRKQYMEWAKRGAGKDCDAGA